MKFVQLRRHAPEVQSLGECSLCGTRDSVQVQDHLLAGSPGVPSFSGAICTACGWVLEHIVEKLGAALCIQVEHSQREASEREGAVRARPDRLQAVLRPRGGRAR